VNAPFSKKKVKTQDFMNKVSIGIRTHFLKNQQSPNNPNPISLSITIQFHHKSNRTASKNGKPVEKKK
jgi:hypothetical protein